MKKIQWSDLRYNGEEVELNYGYPVGYVPISSLLKRIDDLTAELSTETELHHKFEKLALKNALDYDTLSEQLANQTERAQRAERLLEKAIKYIPQKCGTCASLTACLRGKPFTPAEALSKYVCEKWKWHGFK